MATIFNTGFAGTSGTDLTTYTGAGGVRFGSTYGQGGSHFVLNGSGGVRAAAASGMLPHIASLPPGSADYTVTGVFVLNTVAGARNGVICRADPLGLTFYCLYMTTTGFNLSKYVSGIETQLTGSPVATAPSLADVGYTLTLSATGSSITGQVQRTSDGFYLTSAGAWQAAAATAFTATDTSIAVPHRAGLVLEGTTSNTVGVACTSLSATGVAPTFSTPNDQNVFYSPYNWYSDGAGAQAANNVNASSTYALSNNPGAYLKFSVSGTTQLNLTIDPSAMVTAAVTAANYPTISWSIDGGSRTFRQVVSTDRCLTISNALTTASHTVEIWFNYLNWATTPTERWNTPVLAIKTFGFYLDGAGATAAYTPRAKRALFYGDSVTEGLLAALVTGSDFTNGNDAMRTYAVMLARVLGAEPGVIGFGSQGYDQAGGGNVPALSTAWGNYYSGKSRLIGGMLSPAPDYLFSFHGINGPNSTTVIQTQITNWRAAAPGAWIFIMIPLNRANATNITTAFNNYVAANPGDAKVALLDPGTSFYQSGYTTGDNVHLTATGQGFQACLAGNFVAQKLAPAGGGVPKIGSFLVR